MKRIDQNVGLATAINFELTDEDLRNINVDVEIAEVAAFYVTEGECGDRLGNSKGKVWETVCTDRGMPG